jgi:DNA-binding XRE family transcriptional regulator
MGGKTIVPPEVGAFPAKPRNGSGTKKETRGTSTVEGGVAPVATPIPRDAPVPENIEFELVASSPLALTDSPDVKQLREKLGLTLDEFASLLGSSARSVSGWENGQPMSQLAERMFREVRALIDRLSALADPAQLPAWLRQPNPTFGGFSPLQLIQSGQMYKLWELIFRIESGDPL